MTRQGADERFEARVRALQVSFGLLALFAVAALFVTGRLPQTQTAPQAAAAAAPPPDDQSTTAGGVQVVSDTT